MAQAVDSERARELIVRAVLECAQPELILLGGSRAWGVPHADSDYDLMLVVGDDASPRTAEGAARDALRSHGISADVIVLTEADYTRRQHDPGFLAYRFAREGHVLYSRGGFPQHAPTHASVREQPPTEGLERWIKRAESDLRAAESLAAAVDPPRDAICFHAHACVEKLLKALVVRSGTYPPRTHDLVELLQLQAPVIRDDAAAGGACQLLMALWPRSRYPNLPEPTPEEARHALDAAIAMRRLIRPFLIADLRGAVGSARIKRE